MPIKYENHSTIYTYIYYDPSRDNEPIYVGKGFNNRAWDRLRLMSRNIHPIIGIINCRDEEQSVSLEIWFIYKFGRKESVESRNKKKITNRRKTAKLTDEQVIAIWFSNDSKETLSKQYGVSCNQIIGIKKQIYWKFLTEKFNNIQNTFV